MGLLGLGHELLDHVAALRFGEGITRELLRVGIGPNQVALSVHHRDDGRREFNEAVGKSLFAAQRGVGPVNSVVRSCTRCSNCSCAFCNAAPPVCAR